MRSQLLLGALLVALLVAALAVTWLVRAPQGQGVLPGAPAPQAAAEARGPATPHPTLDEPAQREEESRTALAIAPAEERATQQVSALAIQALDAESGAPLAGVRLLLWPDPPEEAFGITQVDGTEAEFGSSPATGADGRARIVVPPGRAYHLTTSWDGEARPAEVDVAPLEPGEQRELVLRLTRANDLVFVGRVVDDVGGAPLPEARVRVGVVREILDDLSHGERAHAATVAVRAAGPFDGATEITVDGEGYFELEVRSWKHLVARVEAPGHAWTSVKLATGYGSRAAAREVRLRPAAAVQALVLDGAGAPLEGVEVELATQLYQLSTQSGIGEFVTGQVTWEGRTDATGRCRIEGLPPAAPLALTARRTRQDTLRPPEELVLSPAETRAVELRFDAGADVWGWVRDPSGAGLGRVELWLKPRAEGEGGCLRSYDPGPKEVERSDPDGRFRFAGVPDGEWLVGCSPEGPYAPRAQVVVVRNGFADHEPVVVADGSLALKGRVLGPGDEPLKAHVFAFGKESGCYADTESDDDGTFSLGPLVAETYVLSVLFATSKSGASLTSAASVEADAGRTDVVLRMQSGASISGRIVDPTTGEGVQANVMTAPLAGSEGSASWVGTSSRPDGSFSFDGLAPATYTVFASTPGIRVAGSKPLVLRPGDELSGLELLLEPGARLRVSYDGQQPYGQFRVNLDGQCVAADGVQRGTDTTFIVPAGLLTVECSEYVGTTPTTRTREVEVAVGELASVEFARDRD